MVPNFRIRSTLRRFIQADYPVPARSQAEVEAEMWRNYRWNFTVNLLEGASFWVGLSFVSATTIVPLFISKLTDSPLPVGLAAVVAQGGWFLPQLFTANFVERLPRVKPVVVNLGFFSERVPVWLFIVAALLAARSPSAALVLFLFAYAWFNLGAGLIATAWQDLLARCFPVERRGRFLGTTLFAGTAAGTAAAFLSGRLLEGSPFPDNFAYSFAIAAIAILISWFLLALTREPLQARSAPRQSMRQFWSEMPRILAADKNFRSFLIARLLLALSDMGVGFVTVAAIHHWRVADRTVGGFTAALLIGQTAGNLFFGFLADRRGHKLSLEFAGLLTILVFTLAWLAPDPVWYFGVFALLGFREGARIVSGILVTLEFSAPERRPTYVGLTNTAVGVISMAAPLLGAWLASMGYNPLFSISAAVGVLALVAMRWLVQEPRFKNIAEQVHPDL